MLVDMAANANNLEEQIAEAIFRGELAAALESQGLRAFPSSSHYNNEVARLRAASRS